MRASWRPRPAVDVAVDAVVAGVDLAAREPAVKRGAAIVADGVPAPVPVERFRRLRPETRRVVPAVPVDLFVDRSHDVPDPTASPRAGPRARVQPRCGRRMHPVTGCLPAGPCRSALATPAGRLVIRSTDPCVRSGPAPSSPSWRGSWPRWRCSRRRSAAGPSWSPTAPRCPPAARAASTVRCVHCSAPPSPPRTPGS